MRSNTAQSGAGGSAAARAAAPRIRRDVAWSGAGSSTAARAAAPNGRRDVAAGSAGGASGGASSYRDCQDVGNAVQLEHVNLEVRTRWQACTWKKAVVLVGPCRAKLLRHLSPLLCPAVQARSPSACSPAAPSRVPLISARTT